ncbi:MAG: hypothetical protein G8237_06705 [Magnetococcales bacterium]|nr:metal-dependent hydrolase [Magnetococcales bacterium]NGZ06031.1 hypothetical protein [Magnetococcales bacterium]
MAGFAVHLVTAAVVGGVGVTTLLAVGAVTPATAWIGFAATMLGGVLPDIDADDSIFLDVAFTVLALVGSFLLMFSQVERYAIAELVVLWMMAFLFVKFAVYELFVRFTTHRGIFHSVPAGLFFAGLTAAGMIHLFHHPEQRAWLIGLFVLMGYWVHLLLDELYSLRLLAASDGATSLGSAFKWFAPDGWATSAMYLALVLVYYWTPSPLPTLRELFAPALFEAVQTRWWPAGPWFGIPYF